MLKQYEREIRAGLWMLFVALLALPLFLRSYLHAPIIPADSSYIFLSYLPQSSWYWIIPPLVGIFSYFVLEKILAKSFPQEKQHVILLLFIATPLTLSTYTTVTLASFFFLLTLLSTYFYLTKKFFLSAAPIIFMLLIDPIPATIYSLVLATHAYLRKQPAFLILVPATVLFSILFRQELPPSQLLFGEFGGMYGFSFFIFLLGICSVILFWRTTNFLLVLCWIVLVYFSQFYVTLRLLLLIPLLMKTADAIVFLAKKEWVVPILKKASFLLLACLGLFIIISHTQFLVNVAPQAPLLALAEHMDADPRTGTILTSLEHDDALRYYSSRKVIGVDAKNEFFTYVSINKVSPFLLANDVRFILITPQMKEGVVWQRDDEGLLFLLHNNEKFINTFSKKEYEAWLVLQEYVPQTVS